MKNKFAPTEDRVLVKRLDHEEKSPGGIVYPDNAKEPTFKGTVIAIGPGRFHDHRFIEVRLAIGDTVIFGKYGGTEIELGGEKFLVMREEDVLGVIVE